MDTMYQRAEKTTFQNEGFKEMVLLHIKYGLPRSASRAQKKIFSEILVKWSFIFPEDAQTLRDLLGFKLAHTTGSIRRPVKVSNKYWAAGPPNHDYDNGQGCKDCPDNIEELMDQFPEENIKGQPAEAFKLPDELYQEQGPEPKPASLKEVKSKEALEKYFEGVPGGEVIQQIRAFFKAGEYAYDSTRRNRQGMMEQFFELVLSETLEE